MTNYTKLFNSIVTSTIWTEDDTTRIVWITMLALADKNGEVQGSVPGLARIAGVSLDACQTALDKFLSPDKYSRTMDDEGRRIEKIDGGWLLLNHAKYRAMASKDDAILSNAERQRRHRAKVARNLTQGHSDQCAYCGEAANGVDHVIPISKGGLDIESNLVRSCKRCNNHKNSQNLVAFLNDPTLPFNLSESSITSNKVLSQLVTKRNGKWDLITENRDIADTNTDTDSDSKAERKTKLNKPITANFNEFWSAYPKKMAKANAERAWDKIRPDLQLVLTALSWQTKLEDWTKENGKFVPFPATYLNSRRYEDEKPAFKSNAESFIKPKQLSQYDRL